MVLDLGYSHLSLSVQMLNRGWGILSANSSVGEGVHFIHALKALSDCVCDEHYPDHSQPLSLISILFTPAT